MWAKLPQYWKALIAALGPVFLLIQGAVTDGSIDTQEWVAIAAGAIVAGGVLLKGNADEPPAAGPAPYEPKLPRP